MTTTSLKAGDIVRAVRNDRVFYARVIEPRTTAPAYFGDTPITTVEPFDPRVTYRSLSPEQIVRKWTTVDKALDWHRTQKPADPRDRRGWEARLRELEQAAQA